MTGSVPGNPIHTGQVCVFGSAPNLVLQLQNSLLAVLNCTCTSRPMMVVYEGISNQTQIRSRLAIHANRSPAQTYELHAKVAHLPAPAPEAAGRSAVPPATFHTAGITPEYRPDWRSPCRYLPNTWPADRRTSRRF